MKNQFLLAKLDYDYLRLNFKEAIFSDSMSYTAFVHIVLNTTKGKETLL